MNWSWGAIQTLTEESLQQDIFDLGESPPPKPKKKSLAGRDAFVEALSYGKIIQSQEWQRNRMVVEVRMTNRLSSLLSQLWSPQPSQPISPCKNTNHPNYPQKHSTWIPEKPVPKYPSPSQLMPYFNIFHLSNPSHPPQAAQRYFSVEEDLLPRGRSSLVWTQATRQWPCRRGARELGQGEGWTTKAVLVVVGILGGWVWKIWCTDTHNSVSNAVWDGLVFSCLDDWLHP